MSRYTSKHTGKKIDDTIDSVVNPNLLDNWYFGNPVDQRGGYVVPPGRRVFKDGVYQGDTDKYYTVIKFTPDNNDVPVFMYDGKECISDPGAAVRGYCQNGYSLDRTFLWDNGVVLIESDYIKLVSTGDYASIAFFMEGVFAEDTVVTASALYKGSFVIDYWGDFGDTVNSDTWDVATITYTIPAGTNLANRFYCPTFKTIGKGKEACIKAVKLELGSQQTLAHQDEDGNWVLNEIPNYGEQLARCQRYFYKLCANSADFCIGANAEQVVANVQFPVPMRIPPACVVHPLVLWNPEGALGVLHDARFDIYPTTALKDVRGVAFYINTGTTYVVTGRVYTFDNPSIIEFSADL